jgi:uncharacterized 2Fe-2S/4Fe-4S cluster protein (DUF4445 family)
MSKRLLLRREELYPVYVEVDSMYHCDMVVSDEFYERYVKAMSEFAKVQKQLQYNTWVTKGEEIRNETIS